MKFTCKVTKGKQIASGICPRYTADGTIKLQLPFFKRIAAEKGYNMHTPLDNLYHGTINAEHGINWEPNRKNCDLYFEQVEWFKGMRLNTYNNTEEYCEKVENFYFIPATIHFEGETYPAYIYLPSPETKESPDTNEYIRFETLAPYIPSMAYGKNLTIQVDDKYITIS